MIHHVATPIRATMLLPLQIASLKHRRPKLEGNSKEKTAMLTGSTFRALGPSDRHAVDGESNAEAKTGGTKCTT